MKDHERSLLWFVSAILGGMMLGIALARGFALMSVVATIYMLNAARLTYSYLPREES